jgi:hypothetical protein
LYILKGGFKYEVRKTTNGRLKRDRMLSFLTSQSESAHDLHPIEPSPTIPNICPVNRRMQ